MPRLRLLPPVEEVRTWDECASVLLYLEQRGGTIAIDTETTGLKILEDRVLFWSMATEDHRWCFPVEYLFAFDRLFTNKDISWCMANAKYDLHLLRNYGISFAGLVFDIIVMDAMVDDTRPHGLKDQAWLTYEAKWGDFKELFLDPVVVAENLKLDKKAFKEFKKLNGGEKLLYVYGQAPQIVIDYASCDAYFTYLLWQELCDKLASEVLPLDIAPGFNTLFDYFNVLEVPMTRTLWNLERRGVLVDLDYVKKIDEPMRDGIAAATAELHLLAGRTFNPKSTDHLRDILFTERGFGLKPVNYTKGGNRSAQATTDEKALKFLMERSKGGKAGQFIFKLLELKKLVKMHGTYVKGIHKHLGPDGRIHARYNQATARTARLSSSDPNIQNIPSMEKDTYHIRNAFIAPGGMTLLDGDYPQIEFRVAAVQADEPKMMEAVCRGWDIHNANTANMYGVKYEDVAAAKDKEKKDLTDEDKKLLMLRVRAKTVGLGTLFGEGPTKMGLQIGISTEAAKDMMQTFFDTYPAIRENILFCHGYAMEMGEIFTMLGRMRRLHRIGSPLSDKKIISQEKRQAYNMHVQGSAAELMKLAMLKVDNDPDFASLGGVLIMSVHDELVSEAPLDTAKDCAEIMKNHMGDPINWGPLKWKYPVPITPDIGSAKRWGSAK